MSAFDNLSEDELRAELMNYGVHNIGPITQSTRKVYIKKLVNLSGGGDAAVAPQPEPPREVSFADDSDDIIINGNGAVELNGEADESESILEEDQDVSLKSQNRTNVSAFPEDEVDDYIESSRIISPEESMRRFSSPLTQKRRGMKNQQYRLKFFLIAILGALLSLLFANIFILPFFDLKSISN